MTATVTKNVHSHKNVHSQEHAPNFVTDPASKHPHRVISGTIDSLNTTLTYPQ